MTYCAKVNINVIINIDQNQERKDFKDCQVNSNEFDAYTFYR